MLFIAQLQAERLAGTLTSSSTDEDSADRPANSSSARTYEDARAAS